MDYAISFLEGIITFISPCLLPMLPLYVSYFAGGAGGGRGRTVKNALGFILGYTLVFLAMGAFAGTIGQLLARHGRLVNIIAGGLVVFFGLNYLGVFRFRLAGKARDAGVDVKNLGFFSSLLLGLAFSISWTPCVGLFLGSALMLASQKASAVKGMLMLLSYSLGLGIPFFASALLIDRLRSAFDFIKKHYSIINRVSGGLLVAIGILMMTGTLERMLRVLGVA